MKFVRIPQSLGYISRLIGEDEIFDRSLIEAVHPGPDHYTAGIANH